MHLVYLPANQAWAFVFGGDLRTASIQPMGADGRRIFQARKDAVAAAATVGLAVDVDGNVGSGAAA